jgi:hypothetical protein
MRVADQVAKCVGFVSRSEKISDYRGTAFFVSVPHGDGAFLHIITAKHVAVSVMPDSACIAVNAKDGRPRWMHTGGIEWFYHPSDETVDVAVMPVATKMVDAYDISSVPLELFATNTVVESEHIGLGDELINVGLFSPFSGSDELLEPIVRTGNIAMMPKSKVPTSKFGKIDAYLAEGRSIGGLSGSPVFVRSTMNMPARNPSGAPAQISGLGPMRLIGLTHGHWDLPLDAIAPSSHVNMGVSIIIPAQKILETLYHPDLCRLRDERAEASGR